MKKRVLSALLALMLTASMLAGCGSSGGKSEGKENGEADKITFAFFCNVVIPEDMDKVEEAINEITKEKINVEVELLPMSLSTYEQQINLMISSGEKLDLFNMFGTQFSTSVTQNKLAAMDPDILKTAAKDTVDTIGEDYMKSVTVDGNVYGFPVLKDNAQVRGVVLNKQVLEDNGLLEEAEAIETPDDLAALYDKVMTAGSDLPMVCAGDTSSTIMDSGFMTYDNLGDYLGVIMDYGQSLDVVNLYETEWYEETVNYIHDWYEKGYILKDSSVNPDTGVPIYQSEGVFSIVCNYHIATDSVIENMTNIPSTGAWLADPLATTTSINGVVMAIPATCENQEPVLKFLNLMYTDPDVVNLIDWGIEGEHYVHVDGKENVITYPEGVNGDNSGYAMNCGWEFGNQLNSYVWENTGDDDYYDGMAEFNENAIKSKAIGFTFDSSSVKTEVAALNNVLNEYRFGLENGEMDPAEYLPKFRQALKEAGIDKVIEEKQRQLDEWAAK